MSDLQRFYEAQEEGYPRALSEIKNGMKVSHWMWYIFPQITGLGYSSTAKYYEIQNLEEANEYLNDEVLGNRLREISSELLNLETNIPVIFGVLTTDNIEQAIERAGTKAGNKGSDAAKSAIEMANVMNMF